MFASDEERKTYYKMWRQEHAAAVRKYRDKWRKKGGIEYLKEYNKKYYEAQKKLKKAKQVKTAKTAGSTK